MAAVAVGVTGAWLSHQATRTRWRPLLYDADFSVAKDQAYAGRYSEDYARYLVGVGAAKEGKIPESNDDWWTWSWRNRHNRTVRHGAFGEITGPDELKRACGRAYGGTLTAGSDFVSAAEDSKQYKISDIWSLCSPLGAKPSTVAQKNSEDYAGKIGSTADKRDRFVSVTDTSFANGLFWDIRNKEFYGDEGFEKITAESDHTFFKTEQNREAGAGRKHIRDICKGAYETTIAADANVSSSPTAEQTLKYCSLEMKVAS